MRSRQISATDQLSRPLILTGRIGPFSVDAQARIVCTLRPNWYATLAVSTCVRCSRSSGTKFELDVLQAAKVRQASLFDAVEKIPRDFILSPGQPRLRLPVFETSPEQQRLKI